MREDVKLRDHEDLDAGQHRARAFEHSAARFLDSAEPLAKISVALASNVARVHDDGSLDEAVNHRRYVVDNTESATLSQHKHSSDDIETRTVPL